MLKVVDVKPCSNALIVVDPHVPLMAQLQGDVRPPETLYWRAARGADSLVEVGIAPGDGRIVSVVVSAIELSCLSFGTFDVAVAAHDSCGVPCVDTSMWCGDRRSYADRFVDEESVVEAEIGRHSAMVWFNQKRRVETWLQVGSIRFSVDSESRLCGVFFGELSTEEGQLLEVALS